MVGTGLDLERMVAQTGAEAVILTIARADEGTIRDLTPGWTPSGSSSSSSALRGHRPRRVHVKLNQLREVNVGDLWAAARADRPLCHAGTCWQGGADHGCGWVHRVGVGAAGAPVRSVRVGDVGPGRSASRGTAVHLRQVVVGHPDMVLADIREADVVDRVFAEHKPEVVFHAAALKHLPMLGSTPRRAEDQRARHVNVLEARRRHGWNTSCTSPPQGRRRHLGVGQDEARRGRDDRLVRCGGGGDVPVGAVRERARLPRLDAACVHGADRARRPITGRTRTSPGSS